MADCRAARWNIVLEAPGVCAPPARQEGVGRAQWLYIQKREEREAKFREAVTLAAAAHARHRYTQYDEVLTPGATKEDRREVRTIIRPEVNRKLELWRKGIQKED